MNRDHIPPKRAARVAPVLSRHKSPAELKRYRAAVEQTNALIAVVIAESRKRLARIEREISRKHK
jgi:hypothetical protein